MHRAGLLAVVLCSVACKRSNDTAPPASAATESTGEPAGTDAAATAPLATTGLAVCDAYTSDFRRCIELAPEAGRGDLRDALGDSVAAWNEALANGESERVVANCYEARDAAEAALGGLGCAFSHEDDPPRPAASAATPLDAAPRPRGPLPKIGIAECDAYLVDYARCIDERVPEPARGPVRQGLFDSAAAWAEAAKEGEQEELAQACREAREAARMATEPIGCTWTKPK